MGRDQGHATMTNRYLHQSGDRITLGDLTGIFRFKTASSIAFDLAHSIDRIEIIGSVELHYPCDDSSCPARLRIMLPEVYGDAEVVSSMINELFAATAIPGDTSYEVQFVTPLTSACIVNRSDVIFGLPCIRICSPDDIGVYSSILGNRTETAIVENCTSTIADIISPILKYQNSKQSMAEMQIQCKHLVERSINESHSATDDQSIADFLKINRTIAHYPEHTPFKTLSSSRFASKQAAGKTVPGSTHWWRFSAVGYDKLHTQALVHVDRVELLSPFSAQRYFVILHRQTPQWSIESTSPQPEE